MESQEQIVDEIIEFILKNDPIAKDHLPFPKDESLFERGVLDSMGVIELITFIEGRWQVEIEDDEITMEKFGSLNKMARLIRQKRGLGVG